MNDEKNKKPSDTPHQPKDPQAVRAQQVGDPNQRRNRQEDPETDESRELSSKEGGESRAGVMLVDRPPRPGTIELRGPPGMAVSVGGDERSTKIVLHLRVDEEGAWTP
jgi:hypothetical protein